MSDKKKELKQALDPKVLKSAEDYVSFVDSDPGDCCSGRESEPNDASGDQSKPGNSAISSKLPDSMLAKIAMHPNASEEEWMHACHVLNEREEQPLGRKSFWSRRIVVLSILGCAIAGSAFSFVMNSKPQTDSHSAPQVSSPVPYIISKANWQNEELKQRVLIQIAQAIHKRAWSEEKAAKELSLDKVEISNLINGRNTAFTSDQLNKMAFVLGLNFNFPERATEGELQDAVDYYSRALDLDPSNEEALISRGRAYQWLKKYDLQIADMDRWVKLKPGQEDALVARAMAFENALRFKEALADFNEVQRRFPDADIYQNRAILHSDMGNYKLSIADSTKAIELMKNPRPGPYFNRAGAYEALGKTKEALLDWQTVLQIDPNDSYAKKAIERLQK